MHQNKSWKKTSHGSFIELYSSSKDMVFSNEKPILIIGGVHGDEPEGVFLVQALTEWLKKMYQKGHTIKPWIIIPCLNPDGFSKKERVNGNGVDLNRNFPSKDWSTEHKQPRYYPGTQAASEIETQAVIEIVEKTKPQLIIHCHSWKPAIVYTGESAKKTAEVFSEKSGYELQADIGYPTPGSLGQYGYLNCKTGVICIEEREGADQQETWQRFSEAFEILLGVSNA